MSLAEIVAFALGGAGLVLAPRITPPVRPGTPTRLAIYYGYPSLANGSNGDVEQAAAVFSNYDVVILGDGLEFARPVSGEPTVRGGNPEEHQKTSRIIAAVHERNPHTRVFGYVCLGEIRISEKQQVSLTAEQLRHRIRLWKAMGVAGIFLDEAGYDYSVVTRERQNMTVSMIHELGLSAFMNAYFPDHLFSVDDKPPYATGAGKNPKHLPSLLGERDMFLLESFQIKNGVYEEVPAWRGRLRRALEFRDRYGPQIFATTTTTEAKPFDIERFNYAWWTAALFGLDGFGWGAPHFAAVTNVLPDQQCSLETSTWSDFGRPRGVGSNDIFVWKKVGKSLIVIDSRDHSVRRLPAPDGLKVTNIEALIQSPQATRLQICGANP